MPFVKVNSETNYCLTVRHLWSSHQVVTSLAAYKRFDKLKPQ